MHASRAVKEFKHYETRKNLPSADPHEKAMNMAGKSASNRLHMDTDDEQPTTFPMTVDRKQSLRERRPTSARR